MSETQQVTFTLIQSEFKRQKTIKFIEEDLNSNREQKEEDIMDKSTQIHGITPQKLALDYPLLIYKSFLPDDSQIVMHNLAERDSVPHKLDLGQWRFLSFVTASNIGKSLGLT